jgi:hypothetical protein
MTSILSDFVLLHCLDFITFFLDNSICTFFLHLCECLRNNRFRSAVFFFLLGTGSVRTCTSRATLS